MHFVNSMSDPPEYFTRHACPQKNFSLVIARGATPWEAQILFQRFPLVFASC
jgi:hypothetical protein